MELCLSILAQKIANKPYTWGDGTQTRDFTYISDVVDSIIKVFKKKNISGEILMLEAVKP